MSIIWSIDKINNNVDKILGFLSMNPVSTIYRLNCQFFEQFRQIPVVGRSSERKNLHNFDKFPWKFNPLIKRTFGAKNEQSGFVEGFFETRQWKAVHVVDKLLNCRQIYLPHYSTVFFHNICQNKRSNGIILHPINRNNFSNY